MEKGKISAFQMGVMMYPTILATAILTVPSITATYAKQDLWISPIWDFPIGMLLVYVLLKLNKLYPEENIIQYSKSIMGSFMGKTLGIIYLFFFLHNSSFALRQYAEFLIITSLPKTPLFVVMGGMTLVCSFAVKAGIEALARSALVFIPLFTLPLLLMVVMLLPDMEPRNILPVLEKGILPSLKGGFFLMTWFCDLLYLSFLFPFLKDRKKGGKWGTILVIAITSTMVITNLATEFVLGGTTQIMLYPVMNVVRFISIAEFFEHIEAVVIAVWVTGAFIKISIFYYALALGTAQWLGLSNYKSLVLPIGFLQLICSIWVAPNIQQIAHFFSMAGTIYFPFIELILPSFLLFVALIKRKYKDKCPNSSNIR
ncbi:spore gernimation protein [Bacillus sp. MUM 116]|nr:spore gernimation protein [Bacillus sp. MUM 116]